MKPIIIVLASRNETKLLALKQAAEQVFNGICETKVVSCEVDSGVASTPRTFYQTEQGAEYRLQALKAAYPDADYHIAIQGGFDRRDTSACYEQACVIQAAKGAKSIRVDTMR